MPDSPMWCVAMFDLPVLTAPQRREATRFRKFLLDRGFLMVQFSVYVKYWPTGGIDMTTIKAIKGSLPTGGKVRGLAVTDRQWSSAYCFENAREQVADEAPEQLMIF